MNMKNQSVILRTCKMLVAAIVILSMMTVHTYAAAEALNNAADAKAEAEIVLTDMSEATYPDDAASLIEKAKQAISDAIKTAETYIKEKEKFPEKTYKKIEEAIAKAKEIVGKANVTAEELNQAAATIATVIREADAEKAKQAIADAIAEAEKFIKENKEKYTEDTYKTLEAAIATAKEMADKANVTAEELNMAAAAIAAAVSELKEINPEDAAAIIEKAKNAIAVAIITAESYAKERYTEESYKNLEKAIAAAKELAAKANVKAEELSKAAVAILTAIKDLKEKNASEKAIAEATQALKDAAAEARWIEKGNYTDESYQALQDAITEAEALASSGTATLAELNAAAAKLAEAKAALKEKELKVGDTVKYNKNTYKVTSVKNKTVAFSKGKNVKSLLVPATIKVKGVTYKVTSINAKAFTAKKLRSVTIGKNVKKIKEKAFYGSKVTTVTLKTKLLKKFYVENSLKSSKVKTIKVKITKKASKTNKTYVKKYKKYFTKANAGRKVTVK